MRLDNGKMSAECRVCGRKVMINITGCAVPLRIYALGDGVFYGGIAEPYAADCGRLSFEAPFAPHTVIVSDGRLDDKHTEVFRFILNSEQKFIFKNIPDDFRNDFEKSLFSQDSLKACVEFYGHYAVFRENSITYYAFPSDFFTHPLLQFVPYSFWYNANLHENCCGYYFIAECDGKPQFPKPDAVLRITGNKYSNSEQ